MKKNLHYLSLDWENLTKLDNGNVDQVFVSFLTKSHYILDIYAPLKRLSKQKLKFRNKPWEIFGIKKSIFIKNKLLSKYIKSKDITLNEAQMIQLKCLLE